MSQQRTFIQNVSYALLILGAVTSIRQIVCDSFEERSCIAEPIDIVYTWVNGSDPLFLKNLHKHFQDKNEKNLRILLPYSVLVKDIKRKEFKVKTFKEWNPSLASHFVDRDFNGQSLILHFDRETNMDKLMTDGVKIENKTFSLSKVYIGDSGKARNVKAIILSNVLANDSINLSVEKLDGWKRTCVYSVIVEPPYAVLMLKSYACHKQFSMHKKHNVEGKDFPMQRAFYSFQERTVFDNKEASYNRFADNNELRYALRSVVNHANWIRNVYIVTNGQIPNWLNISNPRVKVVTHEEIFANKSHLPTFSSRAIEVHVHRIPGLSLHFIYSNDDQFFGKPILPEDYLSNSRAYKIFTAWDIGYCKAGCSPFQRGNGICDEYCYHEICGWDLGDCVQLENGTLVDRVDVTGKNLKNKGLPKKYPTIKRNGRQLLTAYESSMHYVSSIFDRDLELVRTRDAIAHVPVLLNKNIMTEMQNRFQQYIDMTSSFKTRHGISFQPVFAYYNYMMSVKNNLTMDHMWNMLDKDKSGSLSIEELKRLNQLMNSQKLVFREKSDSETLNKKLKHCRKYLRKSFENLKSEIETSCFTHETEVSEVAKHMFMNCTVFSDKYNRRIWEMRHGRRYQVKQIDRFETEQEHTFLMIGESFHAVYSALKSLLKRPTNFVCFNDNLSGKTVESAAKTRRLVRQYYQYVFPEPSEFELTNKMINKHLHVDEMESCLKNNDGRYDACLVVANVDDENLGNDISLVDPGYNKVQEETIFEVADLLIEKLLTKYNESLTKERVRKILLKKMKQKNINAEKLLSIAKVFEPNTHIPKESDPDEINSVENEKIKDENHPPIPRVSESRDEELLKRNEFKNKDALNIKETYNIKIHHDIYSETKIHIPCLFLLIIISIFFIAGRKMKYLFMRLYRGTLNKVCSSIEI